MSKFDYGATHSAASLATLLIEQQDPVGLALFDKTERQLLTPAATQSQLALIIGQLEQARPDRETDLGAVLQSLGDQIKKRGIDYHQSRIWLTDLTTFFRRPGALQHRISVMRSSSCKFSIATSWNFPLTTMSYSKTSKGQNNSSPNHGASAKPIAPRYNNLSPT